MAIDLSIIIPVFNEEKNVQLLYTQLRAVLNQLLLKSEILFIDDGSNDGTATMVTFLTAHDPSVKLVQLRKHFGKADALSAGFKKSDGKIVITIDGDLQDDPQEIPRFIEKIQQGYDLVSGWKYRRKDPLSKTLPSRIFNNLTRMITGINIHDSNCGYKAYTRDVAKTIHVYGELHRYIPVLAHWKGFRVGEIKVLHHPRKHGRSKYGISRMLKGFIDLLTVTYLTTYMERPLHLFGAVGGALFFSGFFTGIYLVYLWFLKIVIWNRPLPLFAALLMIVGVQFLFTGFIGEMIVNFNRDNDHAIDHKIYHQQ